VILYIGDKNLSSWSLRAWLAAVQSGVPFEERLVRLDRPETKAELAKVSPSGRVPVLADGGRLIWDSLAIAEYLAERAPSLWPEEAGARAHARSIVCEMHSGFADLRKNMPQNIKKRAPGEGRTPEVLADIARICAIWTGTRARFGAGGDFLFGRFTLADAFYAPVVGRFVTYGVEVDDSCAAYMRAVLAHPPMEKWIAEA